MERTKRGRRTCSCIAMFTCLAAAISTTGACGSSGTEQPAGTTSADLSATAENTSLARDRDRGHKEEDAESERTICQFVDIASYLPGGAHEDPDVARVNAEIDATEAAALAQVPSATSLDTYHRMTLLGTAELYDKTLSVFRNVACTTCHVPETGFTGGSSFFNQTIVAQPGSVAITNATDEHPNYRLSNRKPQSYAYAPFSPILHYNATQGTFYGGNFWDFRATGTRLGNPAAEQAEGPPTNPVEMALPDSACAVYRISIGQYRSLFELVWGQSSFAIHWPANVEQVCNQPGPPPASDPLPVHLTPEGRQLSNDAYDHMATAMAQYEASPGVSPFSSKFDVFLAGTTALSPEEERGWELFHGKAMCNQCHLDGTATQRRQRGFAPADLAPLFTDFTNNNIGIPRNDCLPWYKENVPDQYGFTANPAGAAFVDLGLGAFLAGNGGAPNPNPTDWGPLAMQNNGTFQTATLRNVDKRPRPDFVKAYMHNGYLKSLKEVVHFYNTSQALPHCPEGSPGEKVTCWPPPEVPSTLNTKQLGNLHLTEDEEDAIVAFMRTLTDGFVSAGDAGTDQ
jgi:cytochrome c peroxidase